MAVFRYEATKELPEDYTELGTVVARDRDEAKAKLDRDGFRKVRLKQVRGLAALWHTVTSDIKQWVMPAWKDATERATARDERAAKL